MGIVHTFTSAKSDGADTSLVRPANWNDDHDIEDSSIPYYGITENPLIWDAPTGALAQTIYRRQCSGTIAALATGVPHLVSIHLVEGREINNIAVTSVTGATTPTVQQFGIYDTTLARLAVTSDDGSTAWGNNTTKTLALTAPFTPTVSGFHYIAILVQAATPPTLQGRAWVGNTTIGNITPKLYGTSATTGASSLPNPVGALTFDQTHGFVYVYVT